MTTDKVQDFGVYQGNLSSLNNFKNSWCTDHKITNFLRDQQIFTSVVGFEGSKCLILHCLG